MKASIVVVICLVFSFVFFVVGTITSDPWRLRWVSVGLAFLALAEICFVTGFGS